MLELSELKFELLTQSLLFQFVGALLNELDLPQLLQIPITCLQLPLLLAIG